MIEKAINDSLAEAKKRGIQGKEVTPFILAAVAKATGGASLATSILLLLIFILFYLTFLNPGTVTVYDR